MNFGYFDNKQREYVITDPRTPVKWINYIGTRDFGGFVDHTGGALICKDDPTFNRITKYVQQMPSSDFKGETLYIRLHTPHGYQIFSPFFVPALEPLDSFECHVGLGYMRILSQAFGLQVVVTIFVPRGELREVREICITNLSAAAQTVDAIPLVEYTHPDALKQFTNADWVPQTMQSKAVKDGEYLLLFQYPFMNRDRQVNCFSSNLPVASFESDRKVFLGENEYGTFGKPASLLKAELTNSEALRGDNIGALMHHLGTIEPGQTVTLITQLSQAPDMESARAGMEKFRQPQAVKIALDEISAFWDGYLSTLRVETPDAAMNSMLNIHNPYQCYVTKTWSRYLSYYQLGMGSRGIGMRDSSQDVLAVLPAVPQEGKEFLRRLLSFQKRDGSAMHQFNPLTMVGSVGDSIEMEDHPHYYSDDHLWVILGVTAYLKETGDHAFLEEIIPFYDKDRTERPLESVPVLEHLKRGLAFTGKDTGAHGLPLLGFADWNDTVNLPTGAESFFTANLYGKALQEMIDLAGYLGDKNSEQEFRQAYETMKANFNKAAWDGEWFIRYFDAQGNPLGSSRNTYGQIYLNGQSWPVISGFAEPEQARTAMQSVYRKLNTKYGIKLSAPGFNGYDPAYGGVTTFPPGTKENGGIFLHPNPWAMIAEAILGNGNRAYEYYAQINPVAKNDTCELYECEPYVYSQNILGNEHKQFGLGRNSWLSGTASWCYQAATQWILGVRAEYTGLRVDPCIPKAWDGFTVTRRFRGSIYQITVHNPEHVCKGVSRMTVDGHDIKGDILPLNGGAGTQKVEVWLGD